LCLASTNCHEGAKIVDGRDKPGHDRVEEAKRLIHVIARLDRAI
jgi:hypothetical protein